MSFEDREFTQEEVVHSLRLCANGGPCEQCDFYEAECPRGYNPCHEFRMMELAAELIEERTAKVVGVEKPIIGDEEGKTIRVTSCGNCENVVSIFDNYCPNCGSRLIWDEDIPMEYFENGGI